MKSSQESILRTWVFVLFLTVVFLLYSFYAYQLIGDRDMLTWDFGVVEDIPASSPYAIYEKLPYPQHVKGSKGD
jgi:hypothetical protein